MVRWTLRCVGARGTAYGARLAGAAGLMPVIMPCLPVGTDFTYEGFFKPAQVPGRSFWICTDPYKTSPFDLALPKPLATTRPPPPLTIIFRGRGARISAEERAGWHPDVKVRFQKEERLPNNPCPRHVRRRQARAPEFKLPPSVQQLARQEPARTARARASCGPFGPFGFARR